MLSFSSGLSMKTWEFVLALTLAFALILWLAFHHTDWFSRRQSEPVIDPSSN
jgi:hypothetical protein